VNIVISDKVFRPYILLILTHAICLLFWLFPDFDFLRKGFEQREDILSTASFIFLMYILIIFVISYISYHIGGILGVRNFTNGSTNYSLVSVVSNDVYLFYLIVTSIGAIAVFAKIAGGSGLEFIIKSFQSGQANKIKEALYEDYSIGLLSLRYAAIFSGACLISRRLSGIKKISYDIWALLVVVTVSGISSRLTLVASALGGMYLYFHFSNYVMVKFYKIVILILTSFLVLSVLNWSRNSLFYEALGLGFLTGGFSEIMSYLGAPIQGAIFAIDRFLEGYKLAGLLDTNNIHSLSTIDGTLTTNSALLEMTSKYGFYTGMLVIFLTISIFAFFVGFFESLKRGHWIFVTIPIIYSFSEVWRLYIFDNGIIVSLIILSLTLCVIYFLMPKKTSCNSYIKDI